GGSEGAPVAVIDENLLEEFRGPGPCEWCGRLCRLREPHHIFARGLGGSQRLDVRCNLVALGSSVRGGCRCHRAAHAGAIPRLQLLLVAGHREGLLASDIEAEVWRLRREAPAGPPAEVHSPSSGVAMAVNRT